MTRTTEQRLQLPMPPHNPRIAIYSQDGLGLGHMRRTGSIAARLLAIRPDACVLTLGDSQLGHIFAGTHNHDYLKLPSIVKTGPGEWRAVNLPLPFARLLAMRQAIISSAVLSFQPQVLLVDHMPHGAMGELVPTLEALRSAMPQTWIVLGLRDILDAPQVVRRRWQAEGAYEAVERYYDAVLVYGERRVFDMAREYLFPPGVAERLRYCGYLCTPQIARYSSKIRSEHINWRSKGSKLIVAMAGGGADAYPMMSAALDSLPKLLGEQDCGLILITGPFMPAELRRHLQARAHGLPAKVRISVSDALSYIDAADLVIAMAGYNTTMEILRSRRRAILVPRAGPSAEQRMRANLFAERGWIQMLDPEQLSPHRLAALILDSLNSQPGLPNAEEPDLRGLDVAVEYLIGLLPEGGTMLHQLDAVGSETLAELPTPV